ncbi:MAG: alginate lyase family protein [Pseudomonadales bacterium]|nr:alginate lyase family protein [Pseudomonadales bacterium]
MAEIQATSDSSPSFARFLEDTRDRIDAYFKAPPDVPIPRDPGGGYTHEQHKKNGIAIYEAGLLSLFTGDESYANHAKQLLLKYAALYPSLSQHPVERSQYPGRMFWQVLNEAVWVVYAIQGYDAIRSQLSDAERELLENGLFRPLADFLSIGSASTFNRIHNHAAWAVAAVGTTGYVLDDQTYVDLAFKGTNLDGSAGFLKLVDYLFSPDGYYTEGPYYQRYALMPFVIFARIVDVNEPSRDIFRHRDGVLLAAIYACVDLSYNGLFFPLNDAIKDKGLNTVELRYGISIAYRLTEDPRLLDIANVQDGFVLTADSLKYAAAIDAGKSEPFEYISRLFRDGPMGNRGGLGVLRGGFGIADQAVVVKATSHGFGHGHFDRLNWLYYDNGNEIVSDYGSARFLNVEQKEGGRYLPENTTWAKQTISHNTVVVDESSQFQGDARVADEHHPTIVQFDYDTIPLIRAATEHPYENVRMDRVLALVENVADERHLVVDIFTVESDQAHQFDLPTYFEGQFIETNPEPDWTETRNLKPLGSTNGYQHLWLRSRHDLDAKENFAFTWLADGRFYTVTSTQNVSGSVIFAQLGANDPNFNLRPQQTFIRRVNEGRKVTFVSVLESHGEYNGAAEYTINNQPTIREIAYAEDADAQIVRLRTATNATYFLAFARQPNKQLSHTINLDGTLLKWDGYAAAFNGEGKEI